MSDPIAINEEHYRTWLEAFEGELAGLDAKARRLLYTIAWTNGWIEHHKLNRRFPLRKVILKRNYLP